VHPAKREVRFVDKEMVYKLVYSRIRDVIRAERTEYTRPFTEAPVTASSEYQFPGSPDFSANRPVVAENLEFNYKPSLPSIYLGGTFVALSGRGGFTVIDYHAAHERILFEKLLKDMRSATRQLLFPVQVRLSAREYRVLLQNVDIIKTFGIEMEDFGHNTVIVRALPEELDDTGVGGVLSDIAADLIEGTASNSPIRRNLRH